MWLQRGLLAPDPGAVGCFARRRRAHSAGPGRGNLVAEREVRPRAGSSRAGVWAGGGMEVLIHRHRAGSVVRMRPGPTVPSCVLVTLTSPEEEDPLSLLLKG